MTKHLPAEIPTSKSPIAQGEGSLRHTGQRIPKNRLFLAFTIAALADGLSILWALTPPVQWVIDLVTAIFW